MAVTDDAGITALNREFLASDHSTDVLSFLLEPLPNEDCHNAEIIVNVECAVRKGFPGRKSGADKELALYLAHGCNHLTGAEDRDPLSRARMRRRELRWLKQAEAEGLIDGLITP